MKKFTSVYNLRFNNKKLLVNSYFKQMVIFFPTQMKRFQTFHLCWELNKKIIKDRPIDIINVLLNIPKYFVVTGIQC